MMLYVLDSRRADVFLPATCIQKMAATVKSVLSHVCSFVTTPFHARENIVTAQGWCQHCTAPHQSNLPNGRLYLLKLQREAAPPTGAGLGAAILLEPMSLYSCCLQCADSSAPVSPRDRGPPPFSKCAEMEQQHGGRGAAVQPAHVTCTQAESPDSLSPPDARESVAADRAASGRTRSRYSAEAGSPKMASWGSVLDLVRPLDDAPAGASHLRHSGVGIPPELEGRRLPSPPKIRGLQDPQFTGGKETPPPPILPAPLRYKARLYATSASQLEKEMIRILEHPRWDDDILERRTAYVTRWDKNRGFGVLADTETGATYLVNRRAVKRVYLPPKYHNLRPGEQVIYTPMFGPKSDWAAAVTRPGSGHQQSYLSAPTEDWAAEIEEEMEDRRSPPRATGQPQQLGGGQGPAAPIESAISAVCRLNITSTRRDAPTNLTDFRPSVELVQTQSPTFSSNPVATVTETLPNFAASPDPMATPVPIIVDGRPIYPWMMRGGQPPAGQQPSSKGGRGPSKSGPKGQ